MKAEFTQHVRRLFDEALEQPEGERIQYLEEKCGGDAALFEAVQRLLEARQDCGSFLETRTQQVQRVARYVIRGELGRGGMGVVYDAIDPMIGRPLAVKVIHLRAVSELDDAETLNERLMREARSAGQLSHPGIVTIFDVGRERNSAFIAMERVHGPSLRQIVASGHTLAVKEVLRILRQTASALDHAHLHGIVHRDIKPANIMVQTDGVVKVTDFGVAKIVAEHPTVSGLIVGTPSYMSPEQIEGRAVDGLSDQFSLAVLAYELLTGARPFNAESIATLAYLITYAERPSVQRLKPELPTALDPVFARALNRSPAERFQTCLEFVTALEAVLESPVVAVQEPPVVGARGEASERPRHGRRVYLALAIVLTLSAAGFAFRQYVHNQQSPNTSALHASTRSEKGLVEAQSVPLPPRPIPSDTSSTVVPPPIVYPNKASTSSTEAKPKEARPREEVISKPLSTAERADQLYNEGVEQRDGHPEDAVRLFREAAELGDPEAMVELGESYRTGEGVDEDDNAATLWFRRAAEAGDSWGMVSLGAMYLLGDGSDKEAAQWFEKAVEQGNAAAMYDLASLYEKGRGVEKNLDKAKTLYRQSANLGNKEAQRRLEQLNKH